MNSLFASNLISSFLTPFEVVFAVIYTEFAVRCFHSLNYADFISMFTF